MMDDLYELSKLDMDIIKKILKEANKMAFDAHVDKLDCSISFARQRTDIKPEDAIDTLLTRNCHIVFIKRLFADEPYFEIGFSTLSDISYFLFLSLKDADGEKLIEKYDIQKRKFN